MYPQVFHEYLNSLIFIISDSQITANVTLEYSWVFVWLLV